MYENYQMLCTVCTIEPLDSLTYHALTDQARIQLNKLVQINVEHLEARSKPKGNETKRAFVRTVERELVLTYTESNNLLKSVKNYSLTNVPVDDMIEIKNSIQREFLIREQSIRFRAEKMGLDLVVTQAAQMHLFDPRTTLNKSKLK